jgi:glucan biosynthesis protein C
MIVLVLSMHAAVTYSGQGGWYYTEQTRLSKPVLLFFITYQSFLQSFFMPLLFFIAGYFVPGAYDKKGCARFLRTRTFRLGWPLLLYIFIIGPLTEYFISHSWHPDPVDRSFAREYTNYIIRFRFPGGTGPLWFCEALLIFCLLYAGYRQLFKTLHVKRTFTGLSVTAVCLFIFMVGISIFFIRIPFSKGSSLFNLQLAYFGAYILFFAAGILAFRRNFLMVISNRMGNRAAWIALGTLIIYWPLLLLSGGAFYGKWELFQGGLHWQSLGLSFWESLVGISMSLFLIVLFRKKYNVHNRVTEFFSDNSFAVYVFHPPILIGIAILLGGWDLHPVVKFILLTLLSVIASFVICSQIRKLPLLKQIL